MTLFCTAPAEVIDLVTNAPNAHPTLSLQTVGNTFWIVVIIDYFTTEVFPFAGSLFTSRIRASIARYRLLIHLDAPDTRRPYYGNLFAATIFILWKPFRRRRATAPAPRSGGSSLPSSWHSAPSRDTETASLASEPLAPDDVEADHGNGL